VSSEKETLSASLSQRGNSRGFIHSQPVGGEVEKEEIQNRGSNQWVDKEAEKANQKDHPSDIGLSIEQGRSSDLGKKRKKVKQKAQRADASGRHA